MTEFLPNAVIAYKILLTLPATVSSGECSFSKLKLIKYYLRTIISQERLNSLAIISIESGVANLISYEDIINEFATSKARRREFD